MPGVTSMKVDTTGLRLLRPKLDPLNLKSAQPIGFLAASVRTDKPLADSSGPTPPQRISSRILRRKRLQTLALIMQPGGLTPRNWLGEILTQRRICGVGWQQASPQPVTTSCEASLHEVNSSHLQPEYQVRQALRALVIYRSSLHTRRTQISVKLKTFHLKSKLESFLPSQSTVGGPAMPPITRSARKRATSGSAPPANLPEDGAEVGSSCAAFTMVKT